MYTHTISNRDFSQVDQPRDENLELARLEREQEQRMKAITKSYMDVPPIGELHSRVSDLSSRTNTTFTVIVARMSHWKWRETKLQPSLARS